jgi:hypothetical protein
VTKVGTAIEYSHLRKLIAERRKELGLSQLEVDEMAGVQTGYTGKVECGTRHLGDVSFGCILGALGLHVDLMRGAVADRNISAAAEASLNAMRGRYKKMGQKGAAALNAKLTPEERRAAARRASLKRWSDWRAQKAERDRKAKRDAKRAAEAAR